MKKPRPVMIQIPDGAPDFLLAALKAARIDAGLQSVVFAGLDLMSTTRRKELIDDLIEASGGRVALILGCPSDLDDLVEQGEVNEAKVIKRVTDDDVQTPSVDELNHLFGE